jgi:hypothetical protein
VAASPSHLTEGTRERKMTMPYLLTIWTLLLTRLTPPSTSPERGSVTVEHVLWAVAVIAIVGIVVAAVIAYVTGQAANIA